MQNLSWKGNPGLQLGEPGSTMLTQYTRESPSLQLGGPGFMALAHPQRCQARLVFLAPQDFQTLLKLLHSL